MLRGDFVEEIVKYSILLDIYGELLTEKQFSIMDLYFNDNLSLNEIAEIENTSKQAVFDMIKRGEKILKRYEDKLSLLSTHLQNKEIKKNIFYILDKIETKENKNYIEEVKKLLINNFK